MLKIMERFLILFFFFFFFFFFSFFSHFFFLSSSLSPLPSFFSLHFPSLPFKLLYHRQWAFPKASTISQKKREWKDQKRLIHPAFQFTHIKNQIPKFNLLGRRFTSRLGAIDGPVEVFFSLFYFLSLFFSFSPSLPSFPPLSFPFSFSSLLFPFFPSLLFHS